jgi:glycosyltransferase involved in cell wall biosynthesis
MKILHVIPSISPKLGGPSQAVINLVKTLRNLGIEAEIVTTNDNSDTLLDVPIHQKVEYQEVPVWFLPRFEPSLKEFIFSAALTRWLWKYIREYDLIHNHYLFSYAPTCAAALARYYKIPYIVRPIGQLTPWALSQSKLKKQIYTFLIERSNLNQAAAIHCTSWEEANHVRNFGINTIKFISPLGVEQPPSIPEAKQKIQITYKINQNKTIILFLSRIHLKKRLDLLIYALSQLPKNKFHLIIAGTGNKDYTSHIRRTIIELGLTSNISWAGFVTGESKDLLLQGSDIFVLPSFSENFGIAIAEAMAAGLPVVLTPGIQISNEVTKAQAGLVVEGEVESLSDAIAQLLTSPNLRTQMGNNGKQLVRQRYCWNVIAQQLIEHYSTIVRKYR